MDLVAYWDRYCVPFLEVRLPRSERGASLVEYALLVALIAVICIGAVSFLGSSTSTNLNGAASGI